AFEQQRARERSAGDEARHGAEEREAAISALEALLGEVEERLSASEARVEAEVAAHAMTREALEQARREAAETQTRVEELEREHSQNAETRVTLEQAQREAAEARSRVEELEAELGRRAQELEAERSRHAGELEVEASAHAETRRVLAQALSDLVGGSPTAAAASAVAGVAPTEQFLLFAPLGARYRLVERSGSPPPLGEELVLEELDGATFVVAKMGR